QGENLPVSINPNPNLRPAFAFPAHSPSPMLPPPPTSSIPLPKPGPISLALRIVHSDGLSALFSGVSATVLRQTLYSTTRMGLYDVLKHKWTD
ncbi:hypothetical protein EI011_24815, partial [Escherichia coli]|nr:hypothetical protein [Escherichia coli]